MCTLILIFLTILKTLNANELCEKPNINAIAFPSRFFRLQQYNISFSIEPWNEYLLTCVDGEQVTFGWSIRNPITERVVLSKMDFTAAPKFTIVLEAREISLKEIFASKWWLFTIYINSKKVFSTNIQFVADEIKINGDENRHAFISDGDLIFSASQTTDKTLFPDEKLSLTTTSVWTCTPNITKNQSQFMSTFWRLPQKELIPGLYHCFVNISWFLNTTYLTSQYAFQFVNIEEEPPKDFYLYCISNCGEKSDPTKATILEIKCRNCSHDDILWNYELNGRTIKRKFTKILKIKGGLFQPGSQITYTASHVKRQTKDSLTVFYRQIEPTSAKIEINCVENCGTASDVTKQSVYSFKCTPSPSIPESCDDIKWGQKNATGHQPKWTSKFPTTGDKLIFPPYTFYEGETPVITAYNDYATGTHTNTIFRQPPTTDLKLDFNGNTDIKRSTILQVSCSEHCVRPEYYWTWTFKPQTKLNMDLWEFSPDNKTLTIRNEGISSLDDPPDENPYDIEAKFSVQNGDKKSTLDIIYKVYVPKIELDCEPRMKESDKKTDSPRKVWEVEQLCALLTQKCYVTCKEHCKGIVRYEWLTDIPPENHKVVTTKLADDTLIIEKNTYIPGQSVVYTVRIIGRDSPLRKLRINWHSGSTAGATYKFKPDPPCKNAPLNPYIPHKITYSCHGEPCGKCEDIITFGYLGEHNVSRISSDQIPRKNIIDPLADNQTFIVPAYAFEPDEEVTFTIVPFHNPTKITQAVCLFGFKTQPKIIWTCRLNCENCNPSNPTIIHAQCFPSQYCIDVNYHWWLVTNDNKEYNFTKYLKKSNGSSDTIIIPGGVLSNFKGNLDIQPRFRKFEISPRKPFNCEPKTPNITIRCIPNPCEKDEVDYPVSSPLQIWIDCKENCNYIRRYNFSLSKDPKGGEAAVKKGVVSLFLESDQYLNGDSLTVTITAPEILEARLAKTFNFRADSTQFHLVCTYNCDKDSNSDPRLPVSFEAKCTKICVNVTYKWEVRQQPENQEISNKEGIIISNDTKTLLIKENVFKDQGNSKKYHVSVLLTSPQVPDANSTHEIYFKEPASELIVYCIENCNKSNPLEDVKLEVRCLNLCEKEQYTWNLVNLPAEFDWSKNIELLDNNQTIIIKADSFKNKNETVVIASSGSVSKANYSIVFKLPDAVIEVECIGENCGDNANPAVEVEFFVNCTMNCHEQCKFEWIVEKNMKNEITFKQNATIATETNDTQFYLPSYEFQMGDKVKVTAVGCDSRGSRWVTFGNFTPIIVIECIKNCFYNPKMETVFKALCTANCQNLKYNWTMAPQPTLATPIPLNGSVLKLPPNSYSEDTKVYITVNVAGTLGKIDPRFHAPYWEGSCRIFPKYGVAAFTPFYLKCVNFARFAQYYIYQEFQNGSATAVEEESFRFYHEVSNRPRTALRSQNEIIELKTRIPELGMLLEYTQEVPSPKFYLAEDPDSVIVGIGFKWRIYAFFRVAVEVSSMTDQNITSNKQRRNNVQETTLLETINQRLFHDINKLMKRKDGHKQIFQLLAAMDVEITGKLPKPTIRHYRRHFLNILKNIRPYLNALQTMSYLWKMVSVNCADNNGEIFDLMTQILKESIVQFGEFLESENLHKNVIKGFVNETFDLLSHLIDCVITRLKMYKPFVTADYPVNAVAQEEQQDYYMHLAVNQIVEVFDTIMPLAVTYKDEGQLVNYTNFKFDSFSSKEKPKEFFIANETIDMSLHPFFIEDMLDNLTFIFGVINSNFYLNNKATKDMKPPIVYFAVLKNNRHIKLRSMTNGYRIHFKSVKNREYSITSNFTSFQGIIVATEPDVTLQCTISNKGGYSMTVTVFDKSFAEREILPSSEISPWSDQLLTFVSVSDASMISLLSHGRRPTNYSVRCTSQLCISWRSDSWQWSQNDCTLAIDGVEISCACRHMSLFALSFPTIVLRRTRSNSDVYNGGTRVFYAIIPWIVTIIFILCVLFFYFGYRHDSLLEDSPVFLPDNIPGDECLYVIVITTGLYTNAGTTSSVGIQLQGELANSRRHLLTPPALCRRVLTRNSSSVFLLYTPKHLGTIKRVRLWTNASGPQPHWYCERIVVQDYHTRLYYVFESKKWLSPVFGKGICHASVPLKLSKCKPDRKMDFIARLKQAWLDMNLELCIFFHREGINFNCKERIMVFTTSLFVMMITAFFVVQRSDEIKFFSVFITTLAGSVTIMLFIFLFAKSVPLTPNLNFLKHFY